MIAGASLGGCCYLPWIFVSQQKGSGGPSILTEGDSIERVMVRKNRVFGF